MRGRILIALTTLIAIILLAGCVGGIKPGFGKSPKALLNRINDSKSYGETMGELVRLDPDAIPALLDGLKSKNPYMQSACQKVLWVLGPQEKSAIPALAKALRDDDHSVRFYAGHVLSGIGRPAIPALLEAMKDGKPETRRYALISLGYMKPPPLELIPKLMEMFDDENERVAMTAVDMLGTFGPAARDAAPVLMKMLKANPADLKTGNSSRWKIAVALARIEPDASDVLPLLKSALENTEDSSYRNSLRIAIANIEGPHALLDMLAEKESGVWMQVVREFAYLGSRTGEAVALLMKAMESDDAMLRWDSALALGEIGPEASEAIPLLSKFIEENGYANCDREITGLVKIGPEDERVLHVLIKALDTGEVNAQVAAADGLGQMGAMAERAIPHLKQAIANDTPRRIGWCGNETPEYHVRPAAYIAIALIERELEKNP